MKTCNFLFYHVGYKKDYIPSWEIYSIKNKLKPFIKDSLLVDSLHYEYRKFSKEEFIYYYTHINEFEKVLNIDISQFPIDFFISNNRWFNESTGESILIAKLLKKKYNTKVIFVSEFAKYYKSIFNLYFSEEIDFVVDGGCSMHLQEDDIYSIVKNGSIDGKYHFDTKQGYNLVPDFSEIYGHTIMLEFELSRGCVISPNCFYCGVSSIPSGYSRGVQDNVSLFSEMREHGIKKLYFTDSEINFDNSYLHSLLDATDKANLHFSSSVYLLAKNVNLDILTRLSKFGVKHIRIGVETINTKRAQTLSKKICKEDLIIILKHAKHLGIICQVHFIFGFKGETTQEILENISFIQEYSSFMDYIDFYFLKYRPRNSKFGNYHIGQYDLPFIKDNLYLDNNGNIKEYKTGDGSVLDKKHKLLSIVMEKIGKKSISPKEFFYNSL